IALALADGREMPQAAMDLGVLLLERGKAREAQREFERALHWQPDTADVHFGLAQALLADGDLPAAQARLERCLALDGAHGPARAYDPLHPRARAMDDRRLSELLEEGVSS